MNIDLSLFSENDRFDKIKRLNSQTHIMSSVSNTWILEEVFFYPNIILKNIPLFPVERKFLAKVKLYKFDNSINKDKDSFKQVYSYEKQENSDLYIQKPLRQTFKNKIIFNDGKSCTPLEALDILKTKYDVFSTGSVYDSEKEEMILLMNISKCENIVENITSSYLIEDNMCCIDSNNQLKVYKKYFISSKEYVNDEIEFVDKYPQNLKFVCADVCIAGNNWLVYPALVSNNKNQIMLKNNHVYRTVCKDSIDVLEDMLDDTEMYPSNFQSNENSCGDVGVKGDEFKGKRTFLIIKNTFQCGGVYLNQSSFSFVSYYSLIDVSADYYLANDYWNKYSKDLSSSIRKYYNADGTITVSGGIYKQEPIKELFQTTKENAQLYMKNTGYNTSAECPPIPLEITSIDTSGYFQRYVIYPMQGKGNGVMTFDGNLIANGTADDYLQVTINGNVVYSDSDHSVVTYYNQKLCSFKKGDVLKVYLADNAAGVCYFRGSLILEPIIN